MRSVHMIGDIFLIFVTDPEAQRQHVGPYAPTEVRLADAASRPEEKGEAAEHPTRPVGPPGYHRRQRPEYRRQSPHVGEGPCAESQPKRRKDVLVLRVHPAWVPHSIPLSIPLHPPDRSNRPTSPTGRPRSVARCRLSVQIVGFGPKVFLSQQKCLPMFPGSTPRGSMFGVADALMADGYLHFAGFVPQDAISLHGQ